MPIPSYIELKKVHRPSKSSHIGLDWMICDHDCVGILEKAQ